MPPAGTRGPARRYCSGRCREATRRDKANPAVTEWKPATLKPVAPAKPREDREREIFIQIAKAAPRYLPPETQIAEIVLEVRSASVRLESVADQTDGMLRARSYELLEALRRALTRFLGGSDGGQG